MFRTPLAESNCYSHELRLSATPGEDFCFNKVERPDVLYSNVLDKMYQIFLQISWYIKLVCCGFFNDSCKHALIRCMLLS